MKLINESKSSFTINQVEEEIKSESSSSSSDDEAEDLKLEKLLKKNLAEKSEGEKRMTLSYAQDLWLIKKEKRDQKVIATIKQKRNNIIMHAALTFVC